MPKSVRVSPRILPWPERLGLISFLLKINDLNVLTLIKRKPLLSLDMMKGICSRLASGSFRKPQQRVLTPPGYSNILSSFSALWSMKSNLL